MEHIGKIEQTKLEIPDYLKPYLSEDQLAGRHAVSLEKVNEARQDFNKFLDSVFTPEDRVAYEEIDEQEDAGWQGEVIKKAQQLFKELKEVQAELRRQSGAPK